MPFTIEDLNYEKDSKERMPWEHYLEQYGQYKAKIDYNITYPDFQVSHEEDDRGFYPLEEMIYAKILTIRFLLNGMKSCGSGNFKTYREMPWGEVYLRQFDGRCIKRLAFTYGNRIGDFKAIMEHIHAKPVKYGDIAYDLPRLSDPYDPVGRG